MPHLLNAESLAYVLDTLSEEGLKQYHQRVKDLKNISIEKQHMFEDWTIESLSLSTIEDWDVQCAIRGLSITTLWEICKEYDDRQDIGMVSEIIMDIIENMVQQ